MDIEMRREMEEQKAHQNHQEKRAANVAKFRVHLMDVERGSGLPAKRAADEASDSVAQQHLELAHATARARNANTLQLRAEKAAAQEEVRRQHAASKAELDAARRQMHESSRAKSEEQKKRHAASNAEMAAQRQQLETQRRLLEKKRPPSRQQREESTDTVAYPDHRAASADTTAHPSTARSRSRAKSSARLPVNDGTTDYEPVKVRFETQPTYPLALKSKGASSKSAIKLHHITNAIAAVPVHGEVQPLNPIKPTKNTIAAKARGRPRTRIEVA
jgi:hypothetical protein